MSSKHLRGDCNYAWPGAEVAVMGAKGSVEILFGRDIAPDVLAKHTAEYTEHFANPLVVAQRGFIDDIIEPLVTRQLICSDLKTLRDKEMHVYARKHSNIPL